MAARLIYRLLLAVQSPYYLLTAVWPLVDIESFMWVTGYKKDIWLVKTVSVLLLPVSLVFFAALFRQMPLLVMALLAGGCAVGLAAIDFYYTGNGTISNVYRVDGYLQAVFFLGWMYLLLRPRDEST